MANKSNKNETLLLENIAEMPEEDRLMAEQFHAIVMDSAPELTPKLWYGMPAYYKGKKVICFLQVKSKFDTRYSTFGFQHDANIDDGNMFPSAYGLKALGEAEEARIRELVKRAVSE